MNVLKLIASNQKLNSTVNQIFISLLISNFYYY